MTETEFLREADACLQRVQDIFEQAFENDELDVDCKRSGNVLKSNLSKMAPKIIVQQPSTYARNVGCCAFRWLSL